MRKKLIEVALPLAAINAASAREKSIRHGHPSTLHLWWARRPLAACRAVLFGQLVDDPSSWPERFPTAQAQDEERGRLFRIIENLVIWENSTNELVLNNARFEIARSLAWNRGEEPPAKAKPKAVLAYLQEHAPPVYDPFCGGGSIPLEAQRLGLRAYGSDLNPVAVLISKALVEIPPKFAGLSPVNPARDPHKRWTGAEGLAEDVRHYGQWMRDEAETRIGHLYPRVEVSEQAVAEQPSLEPLKGQKLTVIAWLWARTVASPNPAAGGAQVPLVSSFMLSTKEGKKAWVEPVLDAGARDGYRFVVRSGAIAKEDETKAKAGNKASRGSFTCILTAAPMTYSYIDDEANAGRMGARLMAVVAQGVRRRVYLPPTTEHERIARSAQPTWRPEQQCRGTFASNAQGRIYGFKTFGDYFTPRQLVALTTFSDLVSDAREKVLTDARAAGLPDGPRLADGGAGAEAYADAVATYLALSGDRIAMTGNSLVRWNAAGPKAQHAFGRQALPMLWDFAEPNLFADSTGSISAAIDMSTNALVSTNSTYGEIFSSDAAAHLKQDSVIICTDPPYYDNVGYADLSDLFYVWARRMLRTVWPDLFLTVLVPKAEELVATPYRHGGKKEAEQFFMDGMRRAIANMATVAPPDFPLTIYYAFKQSEIAEEGVASTGWATFLQAVANGGLVVNGTLPIRTEMRTRQVAMGTNALASSIVLVCRKRPAAAEVTTRAAFWKALKRELPDALRLLQQGNIAPVDMAQASIGPGMAIFTRHAQVLEADDSSMTVKTALRLINTALDEYLSEQEGDYDAWTRFAITWFETHGMAPAGYGAAETLATARNVAVAGVVEAGLLEARGGKVRLLARGEMPADWDPAKDNRLTIWEATQHLIRRLEDNGEPAAADLLRRLKAHAAPARDLAYRLYQVCERHKWAEEGRAYNGLVIAWPELVKLARQTPEDLLI